MRAFKPFIN